MDRVTKRFDFRRWTGIGLLSAVLALSGNPAYAYYGITEYVSALVTLLVVIDFLIYFSTLGLILFTPLGRKPFYGAVWAASGLIALALYLLDLDVLFAISFLWPPLLFGWVLVGAGQSVPRARHGGAPRGGAPVWPKAALCSSWLSK